MQTLEKQIINKLFKEHNFEKAFDVNDIDKNQLIYKYIYNWSDSFINDYNINYGNSQILFIVKGRFYYIFDILANDYDVDEIRIKLEAPNHSILTARLELKEFDVYKPSITNYLYYFTKETYEFKEIKYDKRN